VNADHATQLRLLELQHHDTALAQLEHRRRTLPELAALAERAARAATLHDQVVDAETAVEDLAGDQQRLEHEVDAVRSRAKRDEERLQAGGLPARELESLQHEIATLARRQSALEDELLEVMERREQAESTLGELSAEQAVLDSERTELEQARDTALVEIDASVAEQRSGRESLVADLPGDLVALYEKARAHGGVGAAMLRARRCEGCHIELPGTELAAVRAAAPDAVVRCENCRCILVRTDESGL
jgi:predicted  nucleic acid-binding Zn-ribbon protein